jgi:hypothetical protein
VRTPSHCLSLETARGGWQFRDSRAGVLSILAEAAGWHMSSFPKEVAERGTPIKRAPASHATSTKLLDRLKGFVWHSSYPKLMDQPGLLSVALARERVHSPRLVRTTTHPEPWTFSSPWIACLTSHLRGPRRISLRPWRGSVPRWGTPRGAGPNSCSRRRCPTRGSRPRGRPAIRKALGRQGHWIHPIVVIMDVSISITISISIITIILGSEFLLSSGSPCDTRGSGSSRPPETPALSLSWSLI